MNKINHIDDLPKGATGSKSMNKIYAVVYENRLLGCISCGAVAATRELAEMAGEMGKWAYDRWQVVEVPFYENAEQIAAEANELGIVSKAKAK